MYCLKSLPAVLKTHTIAEQYSVVIVLYLIRDVTVQSVRIVIADNIDTGVQFKASINPAWSERRDVTPQVTGDGDWRRMWRESSLAPVCDVITYSRRCVAAAWRRWDNLRWV